MLTGKLPFKGGYEQAVIYSILHEEPQPLVKRCDNFPTSLQKIVDKALIKEAEGRYSRIEEVIEDLNLVPGVINNGKITLISDKERKFYECS